MNLQICFMNEDSETIEIDGSTAGGGIEDDDDDDVDRISAPERYRQSAPALHDLDATLTPSATLVAQQQSGLENGVGGGNTAPEAGGAAPTSAMKNSKSVGHFLHCLLPGESKKTEW